MKNNIIIFHKFYWAYGFTNHHKSYLGQLCTWKRSIWKYQWTNARLRYFHLQSCIYHWNNVRSKELEDTVQWTINMGHPLLGYNQKMALNSQTKKIPCSIGNGIYSGIWHKIRSPTRISSGGSDSQQPEYCTIWPTESAKIVAQPKSLGFLSMGDPLTVPNMHQIRDIVT